MRNLYSQNPEQVLERQQMDHLKRTQGCALCCKRDLRALAIGGLACGVPGQYPGRDGYCNQWQFDEGVDRGNKNKAA